MHETLLHVPLVVRPPGGADGDTVHRPAALTAFPSVALTAADGDAGAVPGPGPADSDPGFARDAVYATKQPVTADLRERFERACEDVGPYAAESRAVYVPDPEDDRAVRKRYYWGESGADLRIRGPGAVEDLGRIDPGAVDAAFEERDPGVREPLDGRGVSEDTKDQLAALGYY
jgi:arylsulfatase A